MARAVGHAPSTIHRIWRAFGLQPVAHQGRGRDLARHMLAGLEGNRRQIAQGLEIGQQRRRLPPASSASSRSRQRASSRSFRASSSGTVKGQLAFEPQARPELEATVARLDIDFAQHVRRTADMLWSRIFETDRRLAGYDWYDGLDRVAGIATHVAIGGKEYPLEDFPLPERTGPSAAALPSRPETIRTDLAVRPVRGPGRTFDVPADLVFAGEPWGWLGDAIPLVTAESGLQPHQLAALLRAGFFSPSDDADADSYDYGNQTSMESHTTKWLIMRDIWTLILSIVLTFSSLRVPHRGEQPCEHTQIIIGRYKQSLANMRTSCPSSTTIFDTLIWRIRQSAPIWVLRDTSLFGSKSTELS